MDGEFAAFLFMASLVIAIAGLIFFWLLTRHRERAQLIDKGADASLFQTDPRKKNYFFTMIIGVLFVCLALGIGLGFVFEGWMQDNGWLKHNGSPGPYFFGIFLMLGIGFIASFFLNKKLINKE
ncbi:MAG: ABC-type Fe3+ transport system permease subunit [Roseivirga sp.]|jgi:ABC-type Fe3+ transport system permease subunit